MVVVPATMELLGERNWWIPRWLDRLLPRVDIERGDIERGGIERGDIERGEPVAPVPPEVPSLAGTAPTGGRS